MDQDIRSNRGVTPVQARFETARDLFVRTGNNSASTGFRGGPQRSYNSPGSSFSGVRQKDHNRQTDRSSYAGATASVTFTRTSGSMLATEKSSIWKSTYNTPVASFTGALCIDVDHEKEAVKCTKCDVGFDTYLELECHKMQCKLTSFQCGVCGKEYRSKVGRDHHRTIVHDQGHRYTCRKCGKKMNTKIHFDGHMNVHFNLKPYECSVCGLGFAYKNNLSRHKKISKCCNKSHEDDRF